MDPFDFIFLANSNLLRFHKQCRCLFPILHEYSVTCNNLGMLISLYSHFCIHCSNTISSICRRGISYPTFALEFSEVLLGLRFVDCLLIIFAFCVCVCVVWGAESFITCAMIFGVLSL